MHILLSRPVLCGVLVAVAACGGQTITEGPADSGPGGDQKDSPAAASDAAGPEPEDSGTGPVGPGDATPVEPVPADAALPVDCLAICEGKAASCGAPSAAAETDCTAMCAASPTQTQLACIQSASCANLAAAFEDAGTVCGIGQPDGG
jgi:hypothetical protein